MINKKLAIIGVGHMGKATVSGLLHGKIINRNNLLLSNGRDNISVAGRAEIIIIAVKPKDVSVVAKEIRNYVKKDAIIISSAACVTLGLLEKYFGQKTKIVRIMPNLPVATGAGIVGWMGNKNITDKDGKLIRKLFGYLGYLLKCKDENMLDKLTIISGCGPAYVAYFMNKIEKITQKYGFSKEQADKIVKEIFSGTLHYLSNTSVTSKKFIEAAATKEGITKTIINDLDKNNFYQILANSIERGYAKMRKIQKEVENVHNR